MKSYYPVKKDGEIIGFINRMFTDDVSVKLVCGYKQRFWIDITDEDAISRCHKMKQLKINSD